MNKNIGTTSANGYPFLSLRERFALFQNLGFHSVALWWGEDENETRKERVTLAQKFNLQVENAHSDMIYSNSLWNPGPYGDIKMNDLMKAIKDCKECCIGCMVIHLTNGDTPPEISDIGLHRLELIFQSAIKNDVILAIENVRTEKHVRYVLDHYQDKHIAFCFDTGHANIWCKTVDWLSLYSNRLAAVHLHDNNGKVDTHSVPFTGTVNWVKVMSQIRKCSYSGCLTLETEYRGEENTDHLVNYLKESYQSGLKLGVL